MAEGFVQLPSEGPGKYVDMVPITMPAGTVLTNADGSKTTLTVDTIAYRQTVVLADPDDPRKVAEINGTLGYGALSVSNAELAVLNSIDHKMGELLALLTMALG